jgi:hypothetical protein
MIFDVANLVPVPGDGPMPKDAPLMMLPRGSRFDGVEAVIHAMGPTASVFDEDVSNSARIQKGLKVADEIVLGETLERNVVAFHRNLESWMSDHANRKG